MKQLYHLLVYLTLLVLLTPHPTSLVNQFLRVIHHTVKLTITLPKIILELTFIDLLILPNINTQSLLPVQPVVSLVNLIIVLPNPIPVTNALFEIALVNTLVTPIVLTVTVSHTVHVFT